MYKSLKKWMTVPITLHKHVSTSLAGDKTYANVTAKCYVERKSIEVQSFAGDKTVAGQMMIASTAIYIGEVVGEHDEVTLEGRRLPVKAVAAYYEGNTGILDMMVVYV